MASLVLVGDTSSPNVNGILAAKDIQAPGPFMGQGPFFVHKLGHIFARQFSIALGCLEFPLIFLKGMRADG